MNYEPWYVRIIHDYKLREFLRILVEWSQCLTYVVDGLRKPGKIDQAVRQPAAEMNLSRNEMCKLLRRLGL
jgi:hypothetical protein